MAQDDGNVTPLFRTAREIAFAAHALRRTEVVLLPVVLDGPRYRFLANCLRLESCGIGAGGLAKRIYNFSSLSDETAAPEAGVAGQIIQVLAMVDANEARAALMALGDMLAPPTPDAA